MTHSVMDPPEVVPQKTADAPTDNPPAGNRSPSKVTADTSIADLIDRARNAPAVSTGAWGLSCLSGLMLWAAFFPVDFGPLAWIALVPLLMLARIKKPTRRMTLAVFGGGLLFWGASLQWMRLGHISMYIAWAALAVYLALYFPVFLATTRLAVHRLHVPLTMAAPIVWVALEYIRGYLMTGFSWYLLGHSQYEWTTLIQICDLVGVYGVSFLMVLSAAAIASCLPRSLFVRCRLFPAVEQSSAKQSSGNDADGEPSSGIVEVGPRQQWFGIITSIALVGIACLYGTWQLQTAELTPGPRVALVQGNFTSEVKHDQNHAEEIYQTHRELSGKAAHYQPDVIVWPETMFPYTMFQADPSLTDEDLERLAPKQPVDTWHDPKRDVFVHLRDRAEEAGTALIIGLDARIATKESADTYNSAVLVKPQQGVAGRYDKIHRVPFGEFVPLADTLPFLRMFSPYGPDGDLTAGQQPKVFTIQQWRVMPMICFENSVPHLVRNMVNRTEESGRVDLMVELTNDGWFHESSQLDQHLVTALFRCVETRKPLARAVNTGISGLIDSNGIVREASEFVDFDRLTNPTGEPARTSMRSPETGRFHKGLNAVVVVDVPLDSRSSLYLRFGDWFAGGCLVLALASLCLVFWESRNRSASTNVPADVTSTATA
ncbi:MAG: apolipoprotein N-acyltransferase [Planctomycetaceae bacterium]